MCSAFSLTKIVKFIILGWDCGMCDNTISIWLDLHYSKVQELSPPIMPTCNVGWRKFGEKYAKEIKISNPHTLTTVGKTNRATCIQFEAWLVRTRLGLTRLIILSCAQVWILSLFSKQAELNTPKLRLSSTALLYRLSSFIEACLVNELDLACLQISYAQIPQSSAWLAPLDKEVCQASFWSPEL